MKNMDKLAFDFSKRVTEALRDESDRACVILVASWADHILRIKLMREFSNGNSEARNKLFSPDGPFGSFSTKINVAFCASWLDRDVYHDLNVLRKMRNMFAHSIEEHTLQNAGLPEMVASLKVPKRQYHDWDQFSASESKDGKELVLFTSAKPKGICKDLDLSKLKFRMASSVLIAVLISNLGIPIALGGDLEAALELPEHITEIPD